MARASSERRDGDAGGRSRRGRRRGGSIGRAATLLAFLPLASRAPLYTRLLWSLVTDERTPVARKALLAGALGYVVVGRDVIPDDIPVLGGIDDLVVVALAVDLFLDGVDDDVLEDKLEAIGIARDAFDADVARLRRLLPGPLRRVVRRLPGAFRLGVEALQRTNAGARLRGLRTQEETLA
jgi:uncharacterized membrane protein YkvA (DUF1232 family)